MKSDLQSLFKTFLVFSISAALLIIITTAEAILAPIVSALVAGIVLCPVTDKMEHYKIPRSLGAMITMLLFMGVLLFIGWTIYPIIATFVQRIPDLMDEMREHLLSLKWFMQDIQETQEEVSKALETEPQTGPQTKETPEEENITIPGPKDLIGLVTSSASKLMIFIGTLYFFLLARFEIYKFFPKYLSRTTFAHLCQAEIKVSSYFLGIATINTAFGALVAFMLYLFDYEYFYYWGLGAMLLNFILYLGPIAFFIMLMGYGVVNYDGTQAFVPAMLYLMMNMTEGQFVTPSVIGKHVSINPLMVFVSLVFWLWAWGPVGAIVAIPILVWVKHIFFHDNETEQDNETTQASKAELQT
jgi:predicted PurR-regulated permease PerM